VILPNLQVLRDQRTPTAEFRPASHIISLMLAAEVLSTLATRPTQLPGPADNIYY